MTVVAFSTDGYQLVPDQEARLAKASQALELLRALRLSRVAAEDCGGRATWAFDSYLQLGLHRIVSLGDSITSEWNAKRIVSCAILARSLIETVGAWEHLLDRATEWLRKDDLRAAHGLVMKAMFGRRYTREGDPAFPKATHVMEFVRGLEAKFKGVLHFYDSICEIVHPNGDSILPFGEVDDAGYGELLASGDRPAKEEFVVGQVLFALLMFEIAGISFRNYRERVRPQVGDLERRFGPDPSTWPGDSPPSR